MTEKAEMTGPMRLEIRRVLSGPIDRVWDYLTDGALRQQWFCGGSTATEPGGDVVFEFDHSRISSEGPPDRYADSNVSTMSGSVLIYEKPTRLKFTWDEMHVEGSSTVTILLKDLGGKTELHLIHEDLQPEIHTGVQAGWHAHLDLLVDLMNGDAARDFWVHFNALEADYERAAS